MNIPHFPLNFGKVSIMFAICSPLKSTNDGPQTFPFPLSTNSPESYVHNLKSLIMLIILSSP